MIYCVYVIITGYCLEFIFHWELVTTFAQWSLAHYRERKGGRLSPLMVISVVRG